MADSLHAGMEQMAHVAVIWMESPGLSLSCKVIPTSQLKINLHLTDKSPPLANI